MVKIKFIIAFLLQVVLIATILLVTKSCKKGCENVKVIGANDAVEFDNPNNNSDTQFLVTVAKNNLLQISLGQLVQQYTLNKDIKTMAKLMEVRHTKLMVELTALADKKNIIIPVMPTNSEKDIYKMLSTKSGVDFDKTYCDLMVKEHRNAIVLFDKTYNESNDDEIKAWATVTLPILDLYLDYAINCRDVLDHKK